MHRCIGLIGEQPQYLVGDLLQRWLNRSGVGRERGVLQPSDLHGGDLLRILRQHVAQINARQWYDNQPIHMARGHQHDAFLLHFRRPPDTQRQLPAASVDQRLKCVDKPR